MSNFIGEISLDIMENLVMPWRTLIIEGENPAKAMFEKYRAGVTTTFSYNYYNNISRVYKSNSGYYRIINIPNAGITGLEADLNDVKQYQAFMNMLDETNLEQYSRLLSQGKDVPKPPMYGFRKKLLPVTLQHNPHIHQMKPIPLQHMPKIKK